MARGWVGLARPLEPVAHHIKALGSMEFNAAAGFAVAERYAFFLELNASLAAEGHSKVFNAPAWTAQRAGCAHQ